ncbi:MAG TPA: Ig-like domain-containing protein, partial [Balneolaceae bacterium]|nr:Ig-like domain-containing protein [Balneolaceae bacterium]
TTISATFDEQINPSTLNTATFILRRGRENIEGSVEYSGTTATFIPDENLEFDERYTARITDEVEDLAGNNLGRNFDWRFSTQDDSDDNAPEIVDVEPDDGADDVGVNTTISVTFSEAMNPVSINGFTFQVMEDGPGNSTRSVVGFIDYSGFTATFTPFSSLNADERYFIVVTGEVEDDAGNEMNEDFEWDFRTRDNDDDDDDDD